MDIVKYEFNLPERFIRDNVILPITSFMKDYPDLYLFFLTLGFDNNDTICLFKKKNESWTRVKKNGKRTNILIKWR